LVERRCRVRVIAKGFFCGGGGGGEGEEEELVVVVVVVGGEDCRFTGTVGVAVTAFLRRA
jgi:hypothetical protein